MNTRLPTVAKKLMLLGILCAGLAGCVVYDEPHPYYGGYYHHYHEGYGYGWR